MTVNTYMSSRICVDRGLNTWWGSSSSSVGQRVSRSRVLFYVTAYYQNGCQTNGNSQPRFLSNTQMHNKHNKAGFTLIGLTETSYFTSPLFYTNSHFYTKSKRVCVYFLLEDTDAYYEIMACGRIAISRTLITNCMFIIAFYSLEC